MEKIRVSETQVIFSRRSHALTYFLTKVCRSLPQSKMMPARRIAAMVVIFLTILAIVIHYLWNETATNSETSTWICLNHSCVSCQKLAVFELDLNSTLCVNVKYISEKVGISFMVLDVIKDFALNKTLPAQGLLQVRLQEPFVKKPGEIQIYLDSVDVTSFYLRACGLIEARKNYLFLQEFKLGCFNITSVTKTTHK